jgi:hypothetical protein
MVPISLSYITPGLWNIFVAHGTLSHRIRACTTPTITRVLILWVTGRGKGYTTTRLSPPSLNTFTGRPLAVVSTALRGTAAAARTADVKSERETYQDTPPRAISCEAVA